MKRIGMSCLVLVLAICAAHPNSPVGSPSPAPPAEVPPAAETRPAVLCVDCDAPFDFTAHKAQIDGLLKNPYAVELRKALYFQDTLHQFESKAHFDNCDFTSAMDYIVQLLVEVDTHAASAREIKAADRGAADNSVKKAFFALGQALHATQDFYAHSNYVELVAPKVKKTTDIRIVGPWRTDDRSFVLAMQAEGLVSGVVFWGFPKKCPEGTATHAELAKDSSETTSGKVVVPHLQNVSQHRIAAFLAREASLALMRDAFKRWPVLREFNGPEVLMETMVDRRSE